MIYGLNNYQSIGHTAQFGFRNFQWVLPGVLVRSSQPNYAGHDQPHTLSFVQVDFLKKKGITCIISSNEYALEEHSKTLLKTYGISYYHFKIADFKAATPAQLLKAAEIIEANRKRGATLVHCGYGEGRTGTIVAGWAMTKHMKTQTGADINAMCNSLSLKGNFGVETADQVESIRAAAKLPSNSATTPLTLGLGSGASFGALMGSAPSFTGPNGSGVGFSGPSGLGMPDDASMPGFFYANFSSGNSDGF
ncbi:protein-tyrosine phosphatase family protein [Hahella sp. HN01]|uniref:phosphatase domain-containing putative toxin n=1 Tax=Hahella sp. HN01 TaxID=2847262 RepID=UPI001C1EDCA6|nr:protein-tyrosine phosphatase family protein [Hahella sp. HN01]MBU6952279.1 dual specificity protein phosphatase family protein [Hahella sp. HN01]